MDQTFLKETKSLTGRFLNVFVPFPGHVSLRSGLWCLFGMLVFIIVEKLFASTEAEEEDKEEKDHGVVKQNGSAKVSILSLTRYISQSSISI